MVFPVVMYGCESWTVKKAERRKVEAFQLWCWRRLLRVPWTARRSNQSVHPKADQSWVFIGRTDDGQGGLTCYNSWVRRESDMTE